MLGRCQDKMDAATLNRLVGKAKCRVFGCEDADNEPQRNLLAALIEGFNHPVATVLCEPSLARKTTRPLDALLIDPIAGVRLAEVKGYALDQIEAIEPGGLLVASNDCGADLRGRTTFYVGCTRAIEYLEVFAHERKGLVLEFERALGRLSEVSIAAPHQPDFVSPPTR